MHISLPFSASSHLPSIQPSRSLQGPELSSLGCSAASHWLPVLHVVVCLDQCSSLNLPSTPHSFPLGFPGGSEGKEFAHTSGDLGLFPGLGRSPEEGNCYPPQYSGLENRMDRGAWQDTVHGVSKSWTQQHRCAHEVYRENLVERTVY